MAGKLNRYFSKFQYPHAEAVLDHARRISNDIGLRKNRVGVVVQPDVLKEHLRKILGNRFALPHYAPIYALRELGHAWGEIGNHFGVGRGVIRGVYDAAHRITAGQSRFHRKDKLFDSLERFFEHVENVSGEIAKQPKPKRKPIARRPQGPRPLTEFHRRVAELAQSFQRVAGNRYDNVKIVEALAGKPKEEIDPGEYAQWMARVYGVICRLKKRGVLEQTKRRVVPRLRQATNEDIEKHRKLIHFVLNKGHTFLRRDWRYYLSYEDAVRIGEEGLQKAVERFDETRGYKFSTYATSWIAGTIARAVTKAARSQVPRGKEKSLDETVGGRTRHELVPAQPSASAHSGIELLFNLHKNGQLLSRDLTIIALRLYGYRLREIGVHYGVARQRIGQIEKRAKRIIKQRFDE